MEQDGIEDMEREFAFVRVPSRLIGERNQFAGEKPRMDAKGREEKAGSTAFAWLGAR